MRKACPEIANNEVEKCVYKARKIIREEMTPVSQIYRQEMMIAKPRRLDFVVNIPQFTLVKHALYNQRQKLTIVWNRGF